MTIKELRAALAAIDTKYDGCRVVGTGFALQQEYGVDIIAGPTEALTDAEEIVFTLRIPTCGPTTRLLRPNARKGKPSSPQPTHSYDAGGPIPKEKVVLVGESCCDAKVVIDGKLRYGEPGSITITRTPARAPGEGDASDPKNPRYRCHHIFKSKSCGADGSRANFCDKTPSMCRDVHKCFKNYAGFTRSYEVAMEGTRQQLTYDMFDGAYGGFAPVPTKPLQQLGQPTDAPATTESAAPKPLTVRYGYPPGEKQHRVQQIIERIHARQKGFNKL